MTSNKELFQIALELIKDKTKFTFAVITESSGSAPRKAGAKMLVLPNGQTYGTIGGGTIEYAASKDALTAIQERRSFVKEYDLSNSKAAELGMICGGHVTIHFQYISPENTAFYHLCLEEIKKQTNIVYIFGGGHVAQELVPVLSHLDFTCIVFDDRPEFANSKSFPDAFKCIVGNFERLNDYINVNQQDYVCIMTRGHQFDYLVQKQILQTPAHYIGVMGSRKKTLAIREKLLADGFSEEEINRCKSPIGLDIHAETPAEIAISIAGELIQERNV